MDVCFYTCIYLWRIADVLPARNTSQQSLLLYCFVVRVRCSHVIEYWLQCDVFHCLSWHWLSDWKWSKPFQSERRMTEHYWLQSGFKKENSINKNHFGTVPNYDDFKAWFSRMNQASLHCNDCIYLDSRFRASTLYSFRVPKPSILAHAPVGAFVVTRAPLTCRFAPSVTFDGMR